MTAQPTTLLRNPPYKKPTFQAWLKELLEEIVPTAPKGILMRALRGKALIGAFLDDDGIHLNLLTLTNGRSRAAWRIHLETLEFVVEEPRPEECWLVFHQTRMKIHRLHLNKDLFSLESSGNSPLFIYAKRSRKGYWHLYFS